MFEKAKNESIRVTGLDCERGKPGRRKVAQVRGDNDTRPTMNCRSEHMAVIGVRQREGVDTMFIVFDARILDMGVHQRADALDARGVEIGPITQEGGDPFFMHARRPMRAKEAMQGQAHEDIPEKRRVENAGVKKRYGDRRLRHSSPSS